MADTNGSGARCVALVGPYLAGKTSLMEAMLSAAGALSRKGSVREANTVGDASPVARRRQTGIELNAAHCRFMDEDWTILDCPGSIEFAQDARNALLVADLAVVVVEPDAAKARMLSPTLKFIDAHDVPHVVFINKMDNPTSTLEETVAALQEVSDRPLVLRHLPIETSDGAAGYVDLISQRAYAWKQGGPSEVIEAPAEVDDETYIARQDLLESLADFDDAMLEKLLEDVVPDEREVYRQLTRNLAADRIVPVMIGAAEQQSGVFRLWKSLRHDTPGPEVTAKRRGVTPGAAPVARVFKTMQARTGKLSLARVWSGELKDGMSLGAERVGGMFRLTGQEQEKTVSAGLGDVVALGRLDGVRTGDLLTGDGVTDGDPAADWPEPLPPVHALAIAPERRDDEVKMSSALHRLLEEDPSYVLDHDPDTRETVLRGQGEIHLAVAIDKLAEASKVSVTVAPPAIPYRETVRKTVTQHARHKKQSGGHGQFADVTVEISPQPRGAGFAFSDRIVGGAVPKQYIPSVETGVRNYLAEGPLGFPVVDVAVCLTDGQYHAVDSSDMAFQTAAQMAMREGMPAAGPVLLEPVCRVEIDVPAEHTSKANQIVTGRRGQLLGFTPKEGWTGWDTVQAQMPQAGIADLIVDLRSQTQGTGTFRADFDHLQELTGREAEAVVADRRDARKAA